jgi:hypothetical protein
VLLIVQKINQYLFKSTKFYLWYGTTYFEMSQVHSWFLKYTKEEIYIMEVRKHN